MMEGRTKTRCTVPGCKNLATKCTKHAVIMLPSPTKAPAAKRKRTELEAIDRKIAATFAQLLISVLETT